MTHGHQPKSDGTPPKLPTTGSGVKPPRPSVTILLPAGYRDAKEFLRDCQFDPGEVSTGELFNVLVSRIDFDGMDPRTFTLGELERAIEGASLTRGAAT